MTVKELIEKLQQTEPERSVYLDTIGINAIGINAIELQEVIEGGSYAIVLTGDDVESGDLEPNARLL